jgi:predicted ATPase/Tfp pilus assembly protein PilF
MTVPATRTRRFLLELRRRKVFRVAAVYGVAAWLCVQIAATTFPALQLPAWTVTFVVVLAAIGFPVALALSWAFEVRPERPGSFQPEHDGVIGEREPPERPAPRTRRAGLPRQSTPFVGRETEIGEVRALLESPECRIVTVCGPGGVGKTRFALHVAEEVMERFSDGAAFVPLSALADAGPLLSTIADRLGMPTSDADVRTQLFAYLHGRSILLVLDNFEHLAPSSGVLAELLDASPASKLLVTSRERLGLHGENLFPLEGLGARGGTGEGDGSAIALFVGSARRVHPGFDPDAEEREVIARICESVGGLPLAIELAAAWIRALPCERILEEIDRDQDFLSDSLKDVPERHRSIRSTFESAWRFLDDPERRAYRRLAVFRGSFDSRAAEAVCDAPVSMLGTLLDKSLLHSVSPGCFEILEVLRQNAERKLRDDPDEWARTRRRHGEYFAGVVRTLSADLGGPDEKRALDRIAAEIANVREAWHWATAERRADLLSAMTQGMFAFHEVRGRAQEGWGLFKTAREALGDDAGSDAPATATRAAARLQMREAILAAQLGRGGSARRHLDAAIATLRESGSDVELAMALDRRGVLAYEAGGYEDARQFFEEALEIARANGSVAVAGAALMHLGTSAFALGEYSEAERKYGEALSRLEAIGDRRGVANCRRNLGIVAAVQNRTDEAERSFSIGLSIDRELGNDRGVATSLQNLGTIATIRGDLDRAETFLHEAVALSRDLGLLKLLAACQNAVGNIAAQRGDHRRAGEHLHRALSTASQIADTPLTLEILVGIARSLALHDERPEEAMRLISLVLQHPAADSDTRYQAESLQDELESSGIRIEPANRGAAPRLPLDAEVAALLAERGRVIPARIQR